MSKLLSNSRLHKLHLPGFSRIYYPVAKECFHSKLTNAFISQDSYAVKEIIKNRPSFY